MKITHKPSDSSFFGRHLQQHMLRLPMRLHNPMGANSRFCLAMRLTLHKIRSNPFQPCPLQGDLTECFALGNVGFALESYSTSQPQWIHLSLSTILGKGWLCLSGSQIYLHIATYAVGKFCFTCCWGLTKTSRGRAAFQKGYPGRDSALKQLRKCTLTLVWWWQQGWPGNLSCHPQRCPSHTLLISSVALDVCPAKEDLLHLEVNYSK